MASCAGWQMLRQVRVSKDSYCPTEWAAESKSCSSVNYSNLPAIQVIRKIAPNSETKKMLILASYVTYFKFVLGLVKHGIRWISCLVPMLFVCKSLASTVENTSSRLHLFEALLVTLAYRAAIPGCRRIVSLTEGELLPWELLVDIVILVLGHILVLGFDSLGHVRRFGAILGVSANLSVDSANLLVR